ncbi:hypothetical protein SAMN05421503_1866 [Terribacillus aidingensis]|uniref:ComG operon protein 7 n=1 Tax=Terribacillus aidingensis TaxID=586416 RepID=A0A285NNM2_9BACI|nr:hypothetical protein [Terribacillus aidingensis]SNZ10808.1 hypothetical protein SAMN05421503_1866 [Terribacillus aidingensis]
MKNDFLFNERGFLHPFLLFVTAFFLLLLTSGSLLLQTNVKSTDLLFEQYRLEQAISIAVQTVEQHYLPQLDSDEEKWMINNQAVTASITINKSEQQILVMYVVQADKNAEPLEFTKIYPADV